PANLLTAIGTGLLLQHSLFHQQLAVLSKQLLGTLQPLLHYGVSLPLTLHVLRKRPERSILRLPQLSHGINSSIPRLQGAPLGDGAERDPGLWPGVQVAIRWIQGVLILADKR